MPDKENEIGAVWEKEDRNGNTYLSGKVGDQSVVIFKNTYKQPGENTPDWRIYKQDGGAGSQARNQQPAPQPTQQPAAMPDGHPGDEDAPF